MSILIPIEGAAEDVAQEVVYSSRMTVEVGGHSSGLARASAALAGGGLSSLAISRMFAEVGLRRETASVRAAEAGTAADAAAHAGASINGVLPAGASRRAVTLAERADQRAMPVRFAAEVGRPAGVPAVAGVALNSPRLYLGRSSLTLSRTLDRAARMAAELAQAAHYRAVAAAAIGGEVAALARYAADVRAAEMGLTILVDTSTPLTEGTPVGGAGYYNYGDMTARLLVNGADIPIVAFQYQAPSGRLGATLNVTLAQHNLAQFSVPVNATVAFDIGVRRLGGAYTWIPLLEGGRLAGRDYSVSFRPGSPGGPGDEVTISALDVMGDRFTLAPRRNVVMYDPVKVSDDQVRVSGRDALRDALGLPVFPVLVPTRELNSHQVLQLAYTRRTHQDFITAGSKVLAGGAAAGGSFASYKGSPSEVGPGLGFAAVVTNIPSYRVSRADFTVEGGWHEGAAPCVSMYGPLYFVTNDILYIIDINRALPARFRPRSLNTSQYQRLGLVNPPKEFQNAIILTYRVNKFSQELGLYFTTRVEQEVEESGVFGSLGYQRTERTVYWRETRHVEDPAQIIAEDLDHEMASTYTNYPAGDGGPGALILVHRETTQNRYLGALRTGYDKRVESLIVTGPDESFQLRTVRAEKNTVSWKQDPRRPGQATQELSVTQIDGLVYASSQTRRVGGRNVHIRYPALVADAYGVISDDGRMEYGPIETITERLRGGKSGQVENAVTVINHMTHTTRTTITQPRTGSLTANPDGDLSRSVLLRDTASEAEIGFRKPAGINAGELPRHLALDLGWRALRRLVSPLRQARVTLPGVAFWIRRGSVINPSDRAGAGAGQFMVTGYEISGQNLGQRGHRIFQALEGVELST